MKSSNRCLGVDVVEMVLGGVVCVCVFTVRFPRLLLQQTTVVPSCNVGSAGLRYGRCGGCRRVL